MKPFELSSTSSCNEFNNYWPYEPKYIMNYENNRNPYGSRHPFYPTMGQPVIYCAQDMCSCDTTPRTIKNRSRDHRRGPNCFVKAFRWYTQEHLPTSRCKNSASPNRDISCFAAWLDVKYDQFLEESQMGSEMYHIKVRQTFEAERGPAAWKKKRRAKSNDGGVLQQRSNHSCHYIMKPKDMSRAPSVCCNPSCATTAGSEFANKSMCKSHSFSNITITNNNKDIDDISPAQGDVGDKSRGDVCQPIICKGPNKSKPNASPSRNCSNTSIRKPCSNTSVKKVEVSTINRTSCEDFCCQCDKETVAKRHAGTQYETEQASTNVKMSSVVTYKSEGPDCSCQTATKDMSKTTSRVAYESVRPKDSGVPCKQGASCECVCVPSKLPSEASQKAAHSDSYRSVSKAYKNIECQCSREKVVTVDAQTQYMARPSNTHNKCDCDVKGFVRGDATPLQSVQVSASRLCPCGGKVKEQVTDQLYAKFAQTTSQTSNHSIYIENKSAREYPLFLKIVCADKLSRENFK